MHENAPMAYYSISESKEVTRDPSEFIPSKQWLEQQGSAAEAEAQAEAERPEKGHAVDQPQAHEQQPKKGRATDWQEGERAAQASGKSTQKLCSTLRPSRDKSFKQNRPLSQERKGKDNDESALKKARRTSAGAPLVLESDTEKSESEVGAIASRVRESRPYYQHRSPRQERAQREREKEQAQRHIQEWRREDQKLFNDLMRKCKRTTVDADHQAWMTRILDLEH